VDMRGGSGSLASCWSLASPLFSGLLLRKEMSGTNACIRLCSVAILAAIFLFQTSESAESQQIASSIWRVDQSNAIGPIARVDLVTRDNSKQAMLVAFEYARRCDPIISKFTVWSGSQAEGLVSLQAVPPGKIHLIINGARYSWHGAEAKYKNAREIGVGLTNEVFAEIESGRVARLQFEDVNNIVTVVPVNGMGVAVKRALELCKSAF
jgi:hypothetical protein